jgi:hypothetical protein
MARKIYVQEPKLAFPVGTEQVQASYGVLDWEEGQLAIENLPSSNDGTRVELLWGEGIGDLRTKVLDNITAFFGVGSNDVIFLGGWV